MPPRTRKGKQKASQTFEEEAKENNVTEDLTAPNPVEIKTEPISATPISRSGFAHSTALFPARRIGVDVPRDVSKDVLPIEVDVKVEKPSTLANIAESDVSKQHVEKQPGAEKNVPESAETIYHSTRTETCVSNLVTVSPTNQNAIGEPKQPEGPQAASQFNLSSSCNFVQKAVADVESLKHNNLSFPVSAKALEQNLILVESFKDGKGYVPHEAKTPPNLTASEQVREQAPICATRQTDEVQVLREITTREYEVVDLTDDTSPPNTQPPSPFKDVLDNDADLPSVDFSTPLLQFLDPSIFNLGTMSAIVALFKEEESYPIQDVLSSEDEADTTDADSVICYDLPSNLIVSKQKEVDDVSMVTGSPLSHTSVNSTALSNDKLSPDSKILNIVLPLNNSLKSNSQDLVDLTVSPITLDSSSSSSTPDINSLMPSVHEEKKIATVKLPSPNKTDNHATSSQISNVDYSSIPMDISPYCSPVKPAPESYNISKKALRNIIKNTAVTANSSIVTTPHLLEVPQEKTISSTTSNLIVPISYPRTVPQERPLASPVGTSNSFPSAAPQEHVSATTRNLTRHHSQPLSVLQERLIASRTNNLVVLAMPQEKPIASATSNFNVLPSQASTTNPSNTSQPRLQNKRKILEDPRQHKKQYQMRKADPRIKSLHSHNSITSPSLTDSIKNSPSVFSPNLCTPTQYSPQFSPSQYGFASLSSHPQPQVTQNNPFCYPNAPYAQYHGLINCPLSINAYPSSHQVQPYHQPPTTYTSPYQAEQPHQTATTYAITHQSPLSRRMAQENPIPTGKLTTEERTARFFAQIPDYELHATSLRPDSLMSGTEEMRTSPYTRPVHAAVPRPPMPTVVQGFVSCVPESLRNRVGRVHIETELLQLLVLDWDVGQMIKLHTNHEFPKLAAEFCQVRNSYSDHLDYYNTYFPLMLVEYWNRLFQTYINHPQRPQFYFVVSDFPKELETRVDGNDVKTPVVQCDTIVTTGDVKIAGKESEIVVITCLPSGPTLLGYVRSSTKRAFSELLDRKNPTFLHNGLQHNNPKELYKVRLKVQVASKESGFLAQKGELFTCSKVMSLRTLLRQNDALRSVKSSPFAKVVHDPLMLIGSVDLFNLPLETTEMGDCLSSLNDRVSKNEHQVSLVALPESHHEQLHALGQVVQYLRWRFQPRLLVCCPDDKMVDAAEKLKTLSYQLVILDGEKKFPKYMENTLCDYDMLVAKSSARTVLGNCDIMLASASSSFNQDIMEEGVKNGCTFDTCILFDAHHLTEPESVAPLAYPLRHFVVLGVPNKSCKTCNLIANYDYKKSFFQRAYETCF